VEELEIALSKVVVVDGERVVVIFLEAKVVVAF